MPTLRECQLGFARALDDERFVSAFAAQIQARGLAGERRVQVYRNNRFACLSDALAAVYPVIRRLVGAAYFAQAVAHYVKAYPSVSGDIHHYGGDFGDFLGSNPGVCDHPYLPDVARLEWLYHTLFHRIRAPALDIAQLATVPVGAYDRLRFRFQPAAQLFVSRYPVLQIWRAERYDSAGTQTISLGAGETRMLVMRDTDGVLFQPLTPGEYTLLKQLSMNATLADALERACEVEAQFDPGAALRHHVLHATLIAAFVTGDDVTTASLHHGG